jgi:hypothetical protein
MTRDHSERLRCAMPVVGGRARASGQSAAPQSWSDKSWSVVRWRAQLFTGALVFISRTGHGQYLSCGPPARKGAQDNRNKEKLAQRRWRTANANASP